MRILPRLDVRCGVVKASRDLRQEREAREATERLLAKQKERELAAHRAAVRARQIAAGCTVLAAVAIVAAAMLGYFSSQRARRAEHAAAAGLIDALVPEARATHDVRQWRARILQVQQTAGSANGGDFHRVPDRPRRHQAGDAASACTLKRGCGTRVELCATSTLELPHDMTAQMEAQLPSSALVFDVVFHLAAGDRLTARDAYASRAVSGADLPG